jgi:hypothetical protein
VRCSSFGRAVRPPERRVERSCFAWGLPERASPRRSVSSYLTISPLPRGAVCFCGTFLRVTPTGRYPARCPLKPGLSSRSKTRDCPDSVPLARRQPSLWDARYRAPRCDVTRADGPSGKGQALLPFERSCFTWGLPGRASPRRPVSSYLTISPMTGAAEAEPAGLFLWHFPSSHPDRTLSCTLPCEARTFLTFENARLPGRILYRLRGGSHLSGTHVTGRLGAM